MRIPIIASQRKKRPFIYGWMLLLLCLSNIMISSGVAQSFSVIFLALLSDFGMSRAELSGIFSLFIFVFFSGGILVGPLVDKFGPRWVIPTGSLMIGFGLIACSRISSPHQLYVFYGLITALGACCTAWLPNSIVISKWFVRKRGMAMGIMMCGNGLGILIFIPLSQIIIEWAGWRTAFLTIALMAFLGIGPLNAVFQRARPHDKGLEPDGEAPEFPRPVKKDAADSDDNHRFRAFSEAMRTRSFWMICLAMFCNPFATFTIVLHQVAFAVEQGFEPMYAASAFGFIGLFAMVGRVAGGTLSDSIGRETAYTIFMISFAAAVSILFFLTPDRGRLLWFYVILMGLGMGVGGAMFPPMMADMFPGHRLGRIMGVSSIFGGVGAGTGCWFAGYLHDVTGGYMWAFIFVLIAIAGAIVFVWIAAPGKVAKRQTNPARRI